MNTIKRIVFVLHARALHASCAPSVISSSSAQHIEKRLKENAKMQRNIGKLRDILEEHSGAFKSAEMKILTEKLLEAELAKLRILYEIDYKILRSLE